MGFEETVLSEKQLKERLGNDIIVGPQAKESLLFQAKISYKAGQVDCARTHFKPDWEIKAQDMKDAEQEGHKAGFREAYEHYKNDHHNGLQAGRQEVVGWMEKTFGYFTGGDLAKIIVDDYGYYGQKGSMSKYEAKLKKWKIKPEPSLEALQ